MELHAVELARIVGDRSERRAGRNADGAETGRQARHAIAMAHPHRRAFADLEHAVEERRVVDDLEIGASELALMSTLDHAAKGSDHRLLAVADAEHGHPRRKQAL